MFCSKCGKPIPDGSGFCLHCGQIQSTGTAAQIASTPSLPAIPPPVNKKSPNGCCAGVLAVFTVVIVIGIIATTKETSNKSQTVANTTPPIHKQENISPPAAKPELTKRPPSESIAKPAPPYRAPILDGAIITYPETAKELKKAGFPKMLKKLGLETIKKANKLMPMAAEKAAKSKKCDAVMMVDISDRSTKGNPIIYVTAKNGTRFYFSEQDLKSESTAVSEQEKLAPLLRRHEVMAEEVIKSKLMHPSTYDRHELGVFQSETTANCNQIIIEFSAKNSFGVELTYLACVQFDKDSNVVGFHMQEKN